MKTLVYYLHKRMLLSQLPVEGLDVVPPALHLRPSQKAVWVFSICIIGGKEGSREHLCRERVYTLIERY